jgi:hypothetical protein
MLGVPFVAVSGWRIKAGDEAAMFRSVCMVMKVIFLGSWGLNKALNQHFVKL